MKEETRFRLTIPLVDAFAFAMGESDLSYTEVSDEMRQVIGLLVIDNLEYAEEWRAAAETVSYEGPSGQSTSSWNEYFVSGISRPIQPRYPNA